MITSPKSFRITEELAEKFKDISKELGGNQQDTLSRLVEAWETQELKTKVPNKANLIDDYNSLTKTITAMFMQSLEECELNRVTIRTEFKNQLDSKDSTIYELQDKNKNLLKYVDEVQNLKEALTQKDTRIAELEQIIKEHEENRQQKEEISEMKVQIQELIEKFTNKKTEV